MADDVRVRNIPQAVDDTNSLQMTAGAMRESKETLEAQTLGTLMEASGAAKDAYMDLFNQYTAAVEQGIQVRENLAATVFKVIEDSRNRDVADASMFRGAGGAGPAPTRPV